MTRNLHSVEGHAISHLILCNAARHPDVTRAHDGIIRLVLSQEPRKPGDFIRSKACALSRTVALKQSGCSTRPTLSIICRGRFNALPLVPRHLLATLREHPAPEVHSIESICIGLRHNSRLLVQRGSNTHTCLDIACKYQSVRPHATGCSSVVHGDALRSNLWISRIATAGRHRAEAKVLRLGA